MAKALHVSGFFGASNGVLSVSILLICFFNCFSGKNMLIIFPFDFDILLPSVPGINLVSSLIFTSGTTNVSPI